MTERALLDRCTRVLLLGVMLTAGACADEKPGVVAVPDRPGAVKVAADVRALRRAYDGAPAVIPHGPFGAACVSCHTADGMAVEGVGFAPPAPHGETNGMRAAARCQQCHVFRRTEELWRASTFHGLEQDLRHGQRLGLGAPPVIPHPVFMRENCRACHTGPAAREEIRTSHPERVRCRQCHLQRQSDGVFASTAVPNPAH